MILLWQVSSSSPARPYEVLIFLTLHKIRDDVCGFSVQQFLDVHRCLNLNHSFMDLHGVPIIWVQWTFRDLMNALQLP